MAKSRPDIEIEKENIEYLFQLSDIKEDEFKAMKEEYLREGKSRLLCNRLAGRSVVPRLRNMFKPPGEIYAPIYYNSDYIIKLIQKPGWGGHIMALVIWDLFVIDIDTEPDDDEDPLIYIKKNIDRFYPNELFYINKTNRGYHVYLVSKTLKHNSRAAIYMRLKLNCDPAHGTNSLYTGSGLRLTRKNTDRTELPSQFLMQYGNGKPDKRALSLYNEVQDNIRKYGKYGMTSIVEDQTVMRDLYETWQKTMKDHQDFGLQHILATAPMTLQERDGKVMLQLAPSFQIWDTYLGYKVKSIWSKFLKSRVMNISNTPALLLACHHSICMGNLYRILKATPDYAIGIHVQESCYFISYRDLLYIDCDHMNRLQMLYTYVRYHPEATFRVVRTNKGYHAFLTSYPVHHQKGIELSLRLGTDPCHLVGVYHRGYSVRVNQKRKGECSYQEFRKVGKAEEDPRLLALYHKHIELYRTHCKARTEIYMHQNITARDIVEKEGYMGRV